MDDKTREIRDGLEVKLRRFQGLLEVQTTSGSEAGQNRARQKINSTQSMLDLIDEQDADGRSRRVASEYMAS
jgi:hypothetical protein